VREVQAVAGADLDDPAGRAGEQVAAVVGRFGFHEAADSRVEAAKTGCLG
jgi:hypothetical protein